MLIRKMLDKKKLLRMLMVGIWLVFLLLGVYSSKIEEKCGWCCRGNKETIKFKTQYLESEQSLHDQDKERQLEVVREKNKIISKVKKVKKMQPGPEIVHHVLTQKFQTPGIHIGLITTMIVRYLYPNCPTMFFKNVEIPYGASAHAIIGMCLSLDRRLLFTSDTDHLIKVWNLELGVCIRSFVSPVGSFSAFQLYDYWYHDEYGDEYDDEQALLSQGKDGKVSVFQPSFSSENQPCVIEHFDTIEKWMPITQRPNSLTTPFNYIFSEDSRFLLAQTALNRITAWNLHSEDHYRDFYFHNDVLVVSRNFLAVTRDQQWLIATTESPLRITLWNFQTGEYTNEKIFDHRFGIYGVDTYGSYAQTPYCLTVDNHFIMMVIKRTCKIYKIEKLNREYNIAIKSDSGSIIWVAEGRNPKTFMRVIALGTIGGIQVWTCLRNFFNLKKSYLIKDSSYFYARVLTTDGRVLIGAGGVEKRSIYQKDDLDDKGEMIIKVWDTSTGELYNAANSITNENE